LNELAEDAVGFGGQELRLTRDRLGLLLMLVTILTLLPASVLMLGISVGAARYLP